MSNQDSSSKTVLITGASRGIGAGIAKSFIEAGYNVALGYQYRQQEAQTVAGNSPNTMTIPIDIGDTQSVQQAFQTINNQFGPVGILINNAGIAQEKPFLEITDEDWMAMLSVNLVGAARCIRAALTGMQSQNWGRIITVSSIGGQWGGMNQVHYAAAKAGLINLTRSMAKLYSKDGITSNCIAPGLIATEMSQNELNTPQGQEKVKNIPCGRLGTAQEVGALAVYLASDEAGYLTGQTFNMNGGMYTAT